MKKYLVIFVFIVVGLGCISLSQALAFYDGKLKVIFCDVGQGDAILIKTSENKLVLLDGGPDESVLACLSRHVPFWQRKLDLVILSHPHADHFYGLVYVMQNYHIVNFMHEALINKIAGYKILTDLVSKQKSIDRQTYAGDTVALGKNLSLQVLSPSKEHLHLMSPNGIISETGEQVSLISKLQYGSLRILLTGDTQAPYLEEVATQIGRSVDILQAPHHGSKTGLSDLALSRLLPKVGIISVGKNKYGHPAKSTLALLERYHIRTFQTIKSGDVVISSDSKTWSIK